MGEEQRLSPEEQLATAREAFENGTDFTVAVEEEFALLDAETLGLVNRFEDVQAAVAGTELEPDFVGELIASEAEVRTGKCADFAEAGPKVAERRSQLHEIVRELGIELGATGAHPWSRWQDQRIIDTPHYRRNDELLRYVVWRNNTFGLHVHVGIRGGDRAIAVCNALRNVLPELLALSASSPFVEQIDSGLHSARTQIFTRMFPRCGIPDAYDGWRGFEDYVAFLYRTRSIDEHTQLWWSVRPHLAYPTVEIRICDAQPDLGEAQALAALAYSLAVRAARAFDEGEPLPDLPNRMLEENLWRAIRWGLSGELLDFARGEPIPARARIEQLIDWVMPVAEESGAAPFLALPAANAAERQQARWQDGETLEQIYAVEEGQVSELADEKHKGHDHDQHGDGEHEHEHGHEHEHEEHEGESYEHSDHDHGESESAESAVDAMLDAIRQAKVGQLVVSSISTFASVAYAKLEAEDLPEAKAAIDVIDALLPFLRAEEEPIRRDFEQALTNLKLAYANAVSPAQ